jgi:hypothetical protein
MSLEISNELKNTVTKSPGLGAQIVVVPPFVAVTLFG